MPPLPLGGGRDDRRANRLRQSCAAGPACAAWSTRAASSTWSEGALLGAPRLGRQCHLTVCEGGAEQLLYLDAEPKQPTTSLSFPLPTFPYFPKVPNFSRLRDRNHSSRKKTSPSPPLLADGRKNIAHPARLGRIACRARAVQNSTPTGRRPWVTCTRARSCGNYGR